MCLKGAKGMANSVAPNHSGLHCSLFCDIVNENLLAEIKFAMHYAFLFKLCIHKYFAGVLNLQVIRFTLSSRK